MRNSRLLTFAFITSIVNGFAQSPIPLNPVPSRIVGHPLPEQFVNVSFTPNLVEGREFYAPQGLALDTSATPPILYVSDSLNNRILAWKNASSFQNGQKADLVIGQPDFYRTAPNGPSVNGSAFSTYLNTPTGLAVYRGDLYVVDNGNNRILRFRKPFDNIGNQFPDLYIGQPNLQTARPNYTGRTDRQGLDLGSNLTSNIAFDTNGNLWAVDVGNSRVLQFRASDVASGGGPLQANLVIGQLDFNSVQPAVAIATRTKADSFSQPSSIAFDPAGRLYVTDDIISGSGATQSVQLGRVLVFSPPFSNAMSASRIMGIPSSSSVDAAQKTLVTSPEGMFFIPSISKMGLVDSSHSRILLFDSFENWPAQDTTFSPLATGVIGQADFQSAGPNGSPANYNTVATASSLARPTAVAFSGTELFVLDSANNRVVVLPFANGTFGAATRVLGQDVFYGSAPNLIEGREFFFGSETGVAIDNTGDVPHLYVSDRLNNRVLGFNDMRKVKAGMKADLVIGQADFTTAVCNFQGLNNPDSGNPDRPTQSSLCNPIGLAVDSNGDLYVADGGNSRVLRFPTPFAHQGQLPQADLVLGQRNFTTRITDPTPSTLAAPYGVSVVTDNGLLVSDVAQNRVLYFPFTANKTFNAPADNGKSATKVFGQQDFTSVVRATGASASGMNAPRHVAADSEARPYVVDSGNNRIMIFDQIGTVANGGAPAAKIIATGGPRGIYVNQTTAEFWVANSDTAVDKYPKFSTCLLNCAANGGVLAEIGVAMAQDSFGNLAVADASNRVAFYYPGLQGVNGASFLPRPLAPGVFASLCSPGTNCRNSLPEFGANTADFNSVPNPLPLPKALGDIQVVFNGDTPAALTYVSPRQINFIVPWNAPTSGTATVEVIQASTGRIWGAGLVAMDRYSPGIFTIGDANPGFRQAAVINQDGNINTTTTCAAPGSYIQIYATGHGPVPDPPADGAPPQGLVSTPFTPRFFVNSDFTDQMKLDASESGVQLIQFSGLSPQFPGLWQINAYIPKSVGPGPQIPMVITAGSSLAWDTTSGFRTTICIK